MLELPSFTNLFVLEFLISFIWSLVLLYYFYYKQYWITFWVLTVSVIASLFQAFTTYNFLNTLEYTDYFVTAILLFYGTSFLYGISLIFSEAGKRRWLKIAGIFTCSLGLIWFSASIWRFMLPVNGMIDDMTKWSTIVGSLVPVLFILNFRLERITASKSHSDCSDTLVRAMNVFVIVALVFSLFFGYKITNESISLYSNPTANLTDHQRELAKPFEARTYVNSSNEKLPYRLLKPLNYDSTRKYPLIIWLHGSTARGTDNVKQIPGSLLAKLILEEKNRAKYPAFVLVPQCPPESSWGGAANFPAVDSLVVENILALEMEFNIDTDSRYVAGYSMGGYGTWHLICTRPNMFAAAIPIAGEGNPVLAQNIVDLPIWVFHGAKDRNSRVKGSRDMIQAIKNAGGNPRYTEYPDKGHNIWKNIYETQGLLDWLFAQKRD